MNPLRSTGYVKRLHTFPTLTQQDLSQHQWHVARIYVQCFYERHEDTAGILLALFHDRGEKKVGDMPAPTKRHMAQHGGNFDAYEDEQADLIFRIDPDASLVQETRVKFCDSWELVEHCLYEEALGNTLLAEVKANAISYASERFQSLNYHDRCRAAFYVKSAYPGFTIKVEDE